MDPQNLIGTIIGKYLVTGYLTSGGMADIYLGKHTYDPALNDIVIKVMQVTLTKPKHKEVFLREGELIVRLNHPDVVKVYEYGITPNGVPYIVMERAKGDLTDVLNGTPFSLKETLEYIAPIAGVLHHLHIIEKLVHRDIKPENILLRADGTVVLSDFGTVIKSITVEQSIQDRIGTLEYMAPEQFLGQSSRATDQYALAVLTYKMLCGKEPFIGEESYPNDIAMQVHFMNMHKSDPVPSFASHGVTIDPEIEECVMRALSKKPEDRFFTIIDFIRPLQLWQQKQDRRYEEHFWNGNDLYDQGRYQEALVKYNKSLTFKPDHAITYSNKALALEGLGRHQEALVEYDKAIALLQKSPATLANILCDKGCCLHKLRRHQEALVVFDNSLAVNPESTTYGHKGVILAELGRCQEALVEFNKALALLQKKQAMADVIQEHSVVLFNKAIVLENLSRSEEALEAVSRALAINPNDANALTLKETLLKKLGRKP